MGQIPEFEILINIETTCWSLAALFSRQLLLSELNFSSLLHKIRLKCKNAAASETFPAISVCLRVASGRP